MNNGNNNERNGKKSNGDSGKNTTQTKLGENGSVTDQNKYERGSQALPSGEKSTILLPRLTEQDIEFATDEHSASWANSAKNLGLGLVWNDSQNGLALQAISGDALRLLTVVDHPVCLRMAAMLSVTLDNVGMRLVIDENTILAEYSDEVVPVTGDPRRGGGTPDDVGVV